MKIDHADLIRKLPAMIQGRRVFAKMADGGNFHVGEPGTYKVCFIDGHDLKWKVFTCEAQNRKEAIGKMFDLFGPSFDHQIKDVYRRDDENETFVEC